MFKFYFSFITVISQIFDGVYQFKNSPPSAERYGDTADECGEAFFLCGKSLLELARFVKFMCVRGAGNP